MATADVTSDPLVRTAPTPFVNEPFIDFSTAENKRAMEAALADVESQLGREYDIILGGRRLKTEGKIVSVNPARPAQVVGVHQRAEADLAEEAVQAALAAFPAWSRTPVAERAAVLFRAADLVRQRSFEFCAWLTFEVERTGPRQTPMWARPSTFWSSMAARP